MNFIHLKSYKTERLRRINSQNKFDKKSLVEWKKILRTKELRKHKTELQKYYSFLRKIDYKHNNSKAYFSHPLRVACSSFYLASNRKKVFETIKLALFHNIVETTNIKKNFLENYLGKKITKQIYLLTVNRKKQWDIKYKNHYYMNINLDDKSTRIVKILDKLDNLFIIGLVSDNFIRERYIREIEKYILPMAKKNTPKLVKYLKGLINESYKIGHYKKGF